MGEVIWEDAGVEVHRLVVGPLDNQVFVGRGRRRAAAVLIDAADDPARLLPWARDLGVTAVVTTHGHWDHIGAAPAFVAAGIPVHLHPADAPSLDTASVALDDDGVLEVGELRLRVIHTPGHTPGSTSFALEHAPLLFTGDTLFPGGPGNTDRDPVRFATIVDSITRRLFDVFPDDTTIWPGHGAPSTLGAERPHVAEWVERGW